MMTRTGTAFLATVTLLSATIAAAVPAGATANDEGLVPRSATASIDITPSQIIEGNSGERGFMVNLSVSGSGVFPLSASCITKAQGDTPLPPGAPPTANYSDVEHTHKGFTFFSSGTQGMMVTTYTDTVEEPDEFFYVVCRASPNPPYHSGFYVYDDAWILNDDVTPTSSLSIDDVSVVEGDSGTTTADFTVTLSPAESVIVEVNYATCGIGCAAEATATPDVDYDVINTKLTFLPGVTSKTASVTIFGDTEEEPDELFFVLLLDPVNALVGDDRGQGTILTDEAPPGQPPVAHDDGPYYHHQGNSPVVGAPGVLANDTDPDSSVLTAVLEDPPAHGTADLHSDGSFTYNHDGSATNADSFTYRASDGEFLSAPATVHWILADPQPPPGTWVHNPATGHYYALTDMLAWADAEAEAQAWGGHLATVDDQAEADWLFITFGWGKWIGMNDISQEGTWVWSSGDPVGYTAWCAGEPNDAGPGEDGAYPSEGPSGVELCWNDIPADGALHGIVERITAPPGNQPPIAIDDGPFFVAEGATLNLAAPGVLGNDSDPDGDPLMAVDGSEPAHGMLAFGPDGSFTYTHDGSETTSDSFTYRADDGTVQSAPATVSITITPVNDPPVAHNDGPFAVGQSGTLTAGGLLGNDTDAEGNPLSVVKESDPAHGTLSLAADGSFTYVHDGSRTGSDSFTYRAFDGADHSEVATVSIDIAVVNRAPEAVDDGPYTVPEGGVVSVPAPGLLSNDSDPDGDPITVANVYQPGFGQASVGADGSFTYTHDGSETTADHVAYEVVDSIGAVSNSAAVPITITPVNDPPVAYDDGPFEVDQGGTLTIAGLLDNDTDAEGDALAAALGAGPAHGTLSLAGDGSFTYVHDGSVTTTDSFTYRASDGQLQSTVATVSIAITAVLAIPPQHSVGLVDPTQGLWRLRDPNGSVTSFFFGNPGDYPMMGDWDCDGVETPGLYRQSDGFVYLRNSNTGGVADIRFFFGNPGDIPLAGDFDGDGCDTVSIYRPDQSQAFIINELGENEGGLGAAEFSYYFGNPGDKPFVGDFTDDGIETVGLHRESTGLVYFRNSHTAGVADAQFIFGDPGDRLVCGDWNRNGVGSPGLFRPSNTTFYLRHTNTPGVADEEFEWGDPSWLPVAGVIE